MRVFTALGRVATVGIMAAACGVAFGVAPDAALQVAAADQSGGMIIGGTLLASSTALDPALSCGKIWAFKNDQVTVPYVRALTVQATLNPQQKVFVRGYLATLAGPTHVNIGVSVRLIVTDPNGNSALIIYGGENHRGRCPTISDDPECESGNGSGDANSIMSSNRDWIYTAGSAGGAYTFALETRGFTTASDREYATTSCPASNDQPICNDGVSCYLNVDTVRDTSRLEIYAVDSNSRAYYAASDLHVGVIGTIARFLDSGTQAFVLPAGMDRVDVTADLKVDTTVTTTEQSRFSRRVVISDYSTGAVLGSSPWEAYAFSHEKHHSIPSSIAMLNGLTPGQRLKTFVEIRLDSGPAIDIIAGKQSGLMIRPSHSSVASTCSYDFEGSTQGWSRVTSCAGFYSYILGSGSLAHSGTGYLTNYEVATGGYLCDPVSSGELEMARYRDFAYAGGPFIVEGWMRSTSTYSGSSSVTNHCLKLLNADTLQVVASHCFAPANTVDTGFQYYGSDFSSYLAGVSTVRVVFGMYDSWSTDWSQQIYIDDVSVAAPEVVANHTDDDCDGFELCYRDNDGDGYGSSITRTSSDLDCSDPGESFLGTDCDDTDPSVHPGVVEVCNGIDDNCAGSTDEGGGTLCDDGNACTLDSCDSSAGCAHAFQDNDGDGVCNWDDCAPTEAGAFAVPAEVTGLSFSTNKDTMSWNSAVPLSGNATVHEVLRGATGQLPVGSGLSESCVGVGMSAATTTDPARPLAGEGYWYLIRAKNSCGPGTYGLRSNGTQRTSTACP